MVKRARGKASSGLRDNKDIELYFYLGASNSKQLLSPLFIEVYSQFLSLLEAPIQLHCCFGTIETNIINFSRPFLIIDRLYIKPLIHLLQLQIFHIHEGINLSTRLDAINPAPPVTSIFITHYPYYSFLSENVDYVEMQSGKSLLIYLSLYSLSTATSKSVAVLDASKSLRNIT